MKHRLLVGTLLLVALALTTANIVSAQATNPPNTRSDRTAYIAAKLGLSYYMGDNNRSFGNFDEFDVSGKFPFGVGLEVGYMMRRNWGIGLEYMYGDYPVITQFQPGSTITEDHPTSRHLITVGTRYLFSKMSKFTFYLRGGISGVLGTTRLYNSPPNCHSMTLAASGCNEESRFSIGPMVGAGFDWRVGSQVSLLLEWNNVFPFPDKGVDGRDASDYGMIDWLSFLGLGLKYDFAPPFQPVQILSIVGPAETEDGKAENFSGTINDIATPPIEYTWDFGDGTTASGLDATHTYETEGSYIVTLTARHTKRPTVFDTRQMSVQVEPSCQAAEIVNITPSSSNPDTQTSVRYSAQVRGTQPITYRWDFGDGSTSSQANPSHTYSTPGTRTVTLEVENCGGTVRRTLSLPVVLFIPAICREIVEMNSAFFDRNSSTLTAEARAQLQENLEILQQCPNLNVRLEGWAAPGERNPQQLSEDRARAVQQFYTDNGIPASRVMANGMGRATGSTKKEGASQYRRVDTIPVR